MRINNSINKDIVLCIMLIYKNKFLVKDVEEGSLLFPTIFTIYLANKESKIILKVHRTLLYLEKITYMEITIGNHHEKTTKGLLSINATIYKIEEQGSNRFKIYLLNYGLMSIISLPLTYRRGFAVKRSISISLK